MTDRKPVRISSPDNAWAIGAMTISFLIPAASVLEIYQPLALEAWSVVIATTWQWVLLFAAVIALATTPFMRLAEGHGRRMQNVLRVEGLATAVVSICLIALWVALIVQYGFGANPLTQILVGGLGITAAFRVGQIVWGLVKTWRGIRAGHIARVEAIAQPKET